MHNPNFHESKIKRVIAKSLQPIFRLVSKKAYVAWQYRYITGHKLNLKSPVRYTEKLQYLRLFVFPFDSKVIACADRIKVRDFVAQKGFQDNLIPLIGVYSNFSDVPWDYLPEAFALKCNHASAFNLVTKNKSALDYQQTAKQFNRWLKTNYGKKTVELHYSPIKPQLICEQHLAPLVQHLPTEYKIHVFNGRARYLYVVTGRGEDIRYDNFYIDWTPFHGAQFNHWQSSENPPQKPDNFSKMVEMAEKLAAEFPFCRIDLYDIDGKIYFSEMTFTPAKGTLIFDDDQADYLIGKWLDITNLMKKG